LFSFLTDIIGQILGFFARLTGSLGLGVILLTVVIRLALHPLTLSQSKSLAAMRELQPKLDELRKKYKDKPEQYQQKLVELYQEHKINPMGGCLPMLIQLPILYALFFVLRDLTGLFPDMNPRFLLWDLTRANHAETWYLLPILSGVTTYGQMRLAAPSDPSQRALMIIMPLFFVYISAQFPAGLVLYWVVANLLSMGQQYLINRQLAAAQKGEKAR